MKEIKHFACSNGIAVGNANLDPEKVTFACSPELNGVYGAGDVDLVWQYKTDSSNQWEFEIDEDTHRDSLNLGLNTRQFLQLKPQPKIGSKEYWDAKSKMFDLLGFDNKPQPMPEQSPEKTHKLPVEMTEDRVIEFIDWINNNWFIPAEDSYWKLDTKNIEYQRTIPKKEVDLFEANELLQMFLNGEGES